RPCRGYRYDAGTREERGAVGVRHELRCRLAARVWIMAAELVLLRVPTREPSVLVDLIGGHVDDGACVSRLPDRLEQVHRAENVRRVGLDRIGVRPQHK